MASTVAVDRGVANTVEPTDNLRETSRNSSDMTVTLKRFLGAYWLVLLNLFFASIAVIGQVGQNVSLPLWTGATSALRDPNCSKNGSTVDVNGPTMDPYFVLSAASFSFVCIFGTITLIIFLTQLILNAFFASDGKRYSFLTVKDDLQFPQWQFVLIGFFDAMNGVLVVFASLPSRTAPFLQAILGNSLIPLTILFRFILLRKRPTLLKLVCAGMVVLGLVLSLIPVLANLDEGSKNGKEAWMHQSITSRILWPLCFMIGFFPAALMNVIEEKSLKDTRKVNLFYFLFWTSLYQLLTVGLFFWVDIVPFYGFTGGSIHRFGENYKFAIQCFFGGEGCGYSPGLSGTIFILMYFVSYVGGGLLIRYAEGATYLAIVQALVTPLGALFWSLFENPECGGFFWQPNASILTYFSIGGIVIMVPAIFLYNIGTFEALKKVVMCQYKKETYIYDYPYSTDTHLQREESEKTPLLSASLNIGDK